MNMTENNKNAEKSANTEDTGEIRQADQRHDEILSQSLQILKDTGRRLPDEAIEVLKIFMATPRHVTVAEFNEILAKNGVRLSEDMVRQALDIARDMGMAREQRFDGHEPRFEHLHPDEHHDHMICVECGGIEEFEDHELDGVLRGAAKERGYTHVRHRIEMYGVCPNCRDKTSDEMPISMAKTDSQVEIMRLEGGAEFQKRLTDMGLLTGKDVTVLKAGGEGPVVLAVGESRMGIGAGMAKKIIVRIKS